MSQTASSVYRIQLDSAYRKAVVWMLIGALAFTLPWLGRKPFHTRGEPREALVIESIVSEGKWILPSGYGGIVPSKPPLMHWLAAACSEVAGEVSNFTARLPSALAYLLALYLFWRFLSSRTRSEVVLPSIAILGVAPEWVRSAMTARVDMVFAVAVAFGLFSLFRWFERGLKGWPGFAIAWFVVAVLTKGPVAVVLPAAVFGIFLLSERQGWWRSVRLVLKCFVPVVALSLLWYVAAYQVGGAAFLAKVYEENLARFFGTMEVSAHRHSPFYLLGSLLVGLLPWSLVGVALWIGSACAGPSLARVKEGWRESGALTRFALIIVVVFLLFFSFSGSKRGVYMLPTYPALAYLLALTFWSKTRLAARWLRWIGLVLGAIGTLAAVLAILLLSRSFDLKAYFSSRSDRLLIDHFAQVLVEQSWAGVGFSYLVMFMLGLAGVVLVSGLFRSFPIGRIVRYLAGFFAVVYLALHALVLPELAKGVAPVALAHKVDQIVPADAPLYSFRNEFYALSFYLGRPLRTENSFRPGDFVVARKRDLLDLALRVHPAQLEVVAESEGPIRKLDVYLAVVKVKDSTPRPRLPRF